jgi:hypothetical protein
MDNDNVTKKVCLFSFVSIVLVVLFIIIPPLFQQDDTILINLMKIIILVILGYTIYLNQKQTDKLRLSESESPEITWQLGINVKYSYVFTFFLGLLFIFVVKSLFY